MGLGFVRFERFYCGHFFIKIGDFEIVLALVLVGLVEDALIAFIIVLLNMFFLGLVLDRVRYLRLWLCYRFLKNRVILHFDF